MYQCAIGHAGGRALCRREGARWHTFVKPAPVLLRRVGRVAVRCTPGDRAQTCGAIRHSSIQCHGDALNGAS